MHKLNVAEIRNPFKPHQITSSQIEFETGKSLADIYPRVVTNELVMAHNGKIVTQEDRASVFPKDGDYVTVVPLIHGGGNGGSKKVLRIVAMLAVMAVAPQMGALYGSFAGSALGIGTAGWTGIFMATGGMLVNAILPPPKAPSDSSKQTATYGIDGPKNTSAEGIPVPICYGKFRYGGNIINNYVINDGSTQWLYMLLNAGEGPIASIDQTTIEINDVGIGNFVDQATQVRLGDTVQQPIEWFASTISPKSVNQTLTESWITVPTNGVVDSVRLDFSAPGGLYDSSSGSAHAIVVPIEVQVRKLPSGSFAPLSVGSSVALYNNVDQWSQVPDTYDGEGQVLTWKTYVPNGSEVLVGNEWQINTITGAEGETTGFVVGTRIRVAAGSTTVVDITGNQSSPVRRSVFSEPLEEGEYEVRVRRTTPPVTGSSDGVVDTLIWTDLNEVINENVTYSNTALLGLKIRLSDQLNSIPKVTYMHGGKLVRAWNFNTSAWEPAVPTSNPAWVALDILTNSRYGGGSSLSRFDLEAWKDWARFCENPYGDNSAKLEFNGVFDATGNVWDAVSKVMRCGRAQLVRVGTKYSVAIERAESPMMMFTTANIIEGSFKETWLPLADRANEIEGTYQDKNDKYRQRTIKVYDTAAITAGRAQRATQIDLMGVTDAQQAWDDLNILLNMNRYIQRTVTFSASVDSLACKIGSVVLVQHDMPLWGIGGRLGAGSTTSSLVLDREVTLENGKDYRALVIHSAIQRYGATVTAVTHTSEDTRLTLSGFDDFQKVDRLKTTTIDVPILSTFSSSGSFGVIIPYTSSFSIGSTCQLWATDVIETRAVVNNVVGAPQTVSSISLSTLLSAAPTEFTQFMFGEVNKVAKPFRIKAISGSHEYTRDITAIEYNETVYDPAGAVPTPNYSLLPLGVEHVIITGVSEAINLHGVSYTARVTAFFESSQLTYRESNVYLSRNGGPFEWVGRDKYAVTVDAAQGDILVFRVVAMDTLGNSAPESSAPTWLYTVEGKTTVPETPVAVSYAFEQGGIRIAYQTPSEEDWMATQVSTSSDFSDLVFEGRVNNFLWEFRPAGLQTLYVRHRVQGGIFSPTYTLEFTVDYPSEPTIQEAIVSASTAMIRWSNSKTSQPIKHYQIRVGTQDSLGSAVYDSDVYEGGVYSDLVVEGDFSNATEVMRAAGDQTAASIVIPAVGSHRIYILAEDMYGNQSLIATHDIVTESIPGTNLSVSPPPAPENLRAVSLFKGAMIEWNAPTYSFGGGNAFTEIFVATYSGTGPLPVFADATLSGRVAGTGTSYIHAAPMGSQLHIFARFVSVAGTPSGVAPLANVNGLQQTIGFVGNADLGGLILEATTLADGSVTASKLADDAIELTKFANGIQPIGIVDSVDLPTTKSADLILWGGALYRWDALSVGYVPSVLGVNSITAGMIQAGAIGVSQLAAGAITTDKLLVTGRGAALNDDPNCTDHGAWGLTGGNIVSVVGAPVGNSAIEIAGSYSFYSRPFAIDPTKKFKIRIAANPTANSTRSVSYSVLWLNAAGAIIGSHALLNNISTPNAWTRYISGELIPTAGAVLGRLYVTYTVSIGGYQFQDIRCEEYIGADLIVDGAIIAGKLAAGAIAVGSAAIENGAIRNALIENLAVDNAKIASMDASKITTGFLDADRIAVGSVDAKIANIQTAQIQNAAITSAKIQDLSIGTIKIANNAVTIPVGAVLSSNVSTAGIGVVTILTAPTFDPEGGRLRITASIDGEYTGIVRLILRINGTDVASISGQQGPVPVSMTQAYFGQRIISYLSPTALSGNQTVTLVAQVYDLTGFGSESGSAVIYGGANRLTNIVAESVKK